MSSIGLYQGYAALEGLEKWQQIISQNLASSSVAGYKQSVMAFEGEALGERLKTTGDIESDAETDEAVTPLASGRKSFIKGEVQPTAVGTDLAIDGKGFFEVSDPGGKKIYTRNGQFHFNRENILVNNQGNRVSGASGDIIRVPGGGDITIERDGRVMQGGAEINKIALYDIKNPETLRPVGGGFLPAESGESAISAKQAVSVLQGYLEASNVDPVHQMVQLIQVSQAYAANSKMISEMDDQSAQAIKYLGAA